MCPDTPLDEYNEGKTITIEKVVEDIYDEIRVGSSDIKSVLRHHLNRLWNEANSEGYREGY